MILLTGASGFLGKTISNVLHDHKIISLGRHDANIIADLTNDVPVLPTCNLIIHAAGKAHSIPVTNQQKQEFYDVNVTGTKNLLRGLERAPNLPKAFVFISTVAVYGKEMGHLINEEVPLLAEDAYGKSKIQAENEVQKWCDKNNVICTILRLPLLAGPNPPGNLLSMIKGIKVGYYFNIDKGKAKKSMVLATDVAKIIPEAANIGGIYNLTDRCHPAFSELSTLISQQLGKSKPINIPKSIAILMAKIGDMLGDKAPIDSKKLRKITTDLTFDDRKAVNTFNWAPTPVLKGFLIG